jgi:cytochrome c-type biogenesis protein CcmF
MWSLVLGQVGRGLTWLALLAFAAAVVAGTAGRSKASQTALAAGVAGLVGAFLSLLALFVSDQFQYEYVFGHGAADHELKYKIAGVWSGQEGSILLWGVCSGFLVLLAIKSVGSLKRWYVAVTAAVLAWISAISVFESPFDLTPGSGPAPIVPPTGQGMAPSLLNYWVTIHPPTIFLGFGSLLVLFGWAAAAVLSRDVDGWIRPARPWAIASLTLIGLGLAMGGFWAYETLGWGGFWMWDPVENTSFVPWCLVAALVHGAFIQVARGTWRLANVILAGSPFLAFCYGTFLTRSGFLGDTSVHSFAEMDRSALWLLVSLMGVSTAGFVCMLLANRKLFHPVKILAAPEHPIERGAFYAAGVWLLTAFAAATAIGMSVPLIQSLAGQAPKVVEERLYNTVLAWGFLPLMILMAVGPFVSWRGMPLRGLVGRMLNVLAVSIGLTGCLMLWLVSGWNGHPADAQAQTTVLLRWSVPQTPWIVFVSWFCVFAIVSNLWRLFESWPKAKSSVGPLLTHVGVVLTVLGLVVSRGLEQRRLVTLNSASPVEAFGRQWMAVGPTGSFADRDNKIEVLVSSKEGLRTMKPGLYYLGTNAAGEPRPMVWPAIDHRGWYDLYLVIHGIAFEATEPTELKPGEQALLRSEQMLVTYRGLRTEGVPGTASARFFAKLTVSTPERSYQVEPMMSAGEGRVPAPVGDKYQILLTRIDAATKAASIQINYRQPAYPAEIFYKPLTLPVWLGVGIMTLGGGLAAYSRRQGSRRNRESAFSRPPTDSAKKDAPEPTAQI